MTHETLISRKYLYETLVENELAGNNEAKDELLCRTYGFSIEELSEIRRGTISKRADDAVILLTSRGFSSQVNYTILPALIYREWDNPKRSEEYLRNALKYRYKTERDFIQNKFGWNVPYIQFLREEHGIYHGNLYEAHNIWKNFTPGITDWSRSLTIPFTIDERVALLLGIYWGDAHLRRYKDSPRVDKVILAGNENNFDLYTEVINPLIIDIHGLNVPVDCDEVENSERPIMNIGSKAIATWLRDDLGFSSPKIQVQPPGPYKQWQDNIAYAYFSGLIATMGTIVKRKRISHDLTINDSDETFVRCIEELAWHLGYTPHLTGSNLRWRVSFSQNEIKQMLKEGAIINPHHLAVLV